MWPFLGGLAAGIGSWLGGKLNTKAVKDTNVSNQALWREQTAYNAPQAQMDRLKEAGLNPNLVYGQVADSKMSNAPLMDAPEQGAPYKSAGASIMDYFQIKNMDAQNRLLRSQQRESAARAASALEDVRYKKYENDQYVGSGTTKSDPAFLRQMRNQSLFRSLFGDNWWEQLKQDWNPNLGISIPVDKRRK